MHPPLVKHSGRSAFTRLCSETAETARAALERDDAEALHDFRVALRRMRVTVDHYGKECAIQRRVVRRLHRLIHLTNTERDSEVMRSWLERQWPLLDIGEQYGAGEWRQHLYQSEKSVKPPTLVRSFAKLEKLLPSLRAGGKIASTSFGCAAAACLQREGVEFVALLRSSDSAERLHAVRLQSKRLRYLLIPFRDEIQECRNVELLLHQLQQLLGDWHDSVICRHSLFIMLSHEIGLLRGKVDQEIDVGGTLTVAGCLPAWPGLLKLYRLNLQRLAQHHVAIRSYCSDGSVDKLDSTLGQAVVILQREGAT